MSVKAKTKFLSIGILDGHGANPVDPGVPFED
jgi:hypothetical protein